MKILKVVKRKSLIQRELEDLEHQGFEIDKIRHSATKKDLVIIVSSITDIRGAYQYAGWRFSWVILDDLEDDEAAEYLMALVRTSE